MFVCSELGAEHMEEERIGVDRRKEEGRKEVRSSFLHLPLLVSTSLSLLFSACFCFFLKRIPFILGLRGSPRSLSHSAILLTPLPGRGSSLGCVPTAGEIAITRTISENPNRAQPPSLEKFTAKLFLFSK